MWPFDGKDPATLTDEERAELPQETLIEDASVKQPGFVDASVVQPGHVDGSVAS